MGTGGEKRAAAEVLAKAKAKTSRVSLVLDGDLIDQQEQLEEELSNLDESSDEAVAVAEQIVAVEAAMKAAEQEFVFKGMGRGRWRKMLADYPPTEDQAAQGAEFDVDEFPFYAMEASLVSPAMTVDQLKELNDESLDEVQFSLLWGACLRANLGGSNRPSSEAARRILNARGSSTSVSTSGLAEAS